MKNANEIKKIVIVGGGTAGWMTALIFADAMKKAGVEILLLESPSVEAIGVGEGSTPPMKKFFDDLGIEESEWMPECNGTYKVGIRFDGWSTKPGFESYFHPFASMLDGLSMPLFFQNVHARLNGVDVHAHPNRYFLATHLADRRLGPKPEYSFPFEGWHAYHFDSVLLGKFLQKKALERGVRHRSCHVAEVKLNDKGDIASVVGREGEVFEADFFVDCTGFASVLLQKTLKTPFVSFSSNLFNDAAVAIPSPLEEGAGLPSETISAAMKHGWAWKIPLTNRFGNGYVYSSSFCTADQAEFEIRESLGLLDSDVEARHLKMKVGRVEQHWNRNCLGVGLSQGFIEPLEATAILFSQRTASIFAQLFEKGDLGEEARAKFNRHVNEAFESTRDFIVTHYRVSSRDDTEYWRANTTNDNLSDSLKEIYTAWASGRSIAGELLKQGVELYFAVGSWYCIMAGSGLFPEQKMLRRLDDKEQDMRIAQIDELMRRSVLNYKPHRETLENLAQQRQAARPS